MNVQSASCLVNMAINPGTLVWHKITNEMQIETATIFQSDITLVFTYLDVTPSDVIGLQQSVIPEYFSWCTSTTT